ncbi:hypothetical protein ED312_20975 [Sinomicrobium pectinilyticum]|uniref:Uncharacterized protein n=1 Tax=Sinomicrobium pectinilyticum TaxID=1084421 RepID=A0A3N0DP29_SINP1|nr:hypothetical protein [Sinomicrobium pectinilyticum]RNL77408.1 hypothetical protein ED312_20975 [Sinomicrobium pectinilyticum]
MNLAVKHTRTALFYFFLTSLMGILLRAYPIADFSFNYRFLVHAHSHIALLGWIYVGLTAVIYHLFLGDIKQSGVYRNIFRTTQVALIGMLVTFPFWGYHPYSIFFSTLFILASYAFTWFFIRHAPERYRKGYSFKCVKAGLYYMVVSSLGPWALGLIMNTLGSTSVWYKIAIYFYLHFQYNGWFLMALCGFLFFILEFGDIPVAPRQSRLFYRMLNAGIILTFFLSVLWTEPHYIFYFLGLSGAVIQLWAYILLFRIARSSRITSTGKTGGLKSTFSLLKVSGMLLLVKLLLQCFSAVPEIATMAYHTPEFIIGYLHWTFLGVISLALFAFFSHFRLLVFSRFAIGIYLAGFFITEFLIFYKGIALWLQWSLTEHYYLLLFCGSLLFSIAIGILLFRSFRKIRSKNTD